MAQYAIGSFGRAKSLRHNLFAQQFLLEPGASTPNLYHRSLTPHVGGTVMRARREVDDNALHRADGLLAAVAA